VELALSTNEGLNKLSDESFDMIITDLGRRENERDNPFAGLEFIKQVREQNNNIPILVYAGDRGMQNQSKLLKAGATKVTQSPVEVQSFINGLRRKLS
jgi:CheY-like chemotaxis protein